MVIAMALVTWTLIKAEPVNNAAMGVSIIRRYRPLTGLTPASTPDAIASGMLGMEAVRPAIRSEVIVDLFLWMFVIEGPWLGARPATLLHIAAPRYRLLQWFA